jgi:fatty acid desaturase
LRRPRVKHLVACRREPAVAEADRERLNRKLDRLSGKLPSWLGRALRWLSGPTGRWVRIPVALLLIAGGFVGFLPVLGFWMVPLGLLLLALDVPFLRAPILKLLEWLERQWRRLKDWWRRRRQG